MKKTISLLILILCTTSVFATDFYGPTPGTASVIKKNNSFTLSNNILSITYKTNINNLSVSNIINKINGASNPIRVGELFKLQLNNGKIITDSAMISGTPVIRRIIRKSSDLRVRERFNGWKISIPFTYNLGWKQLSLTWSAVLRDASNYVNHEISYTAVNGQWDIDRIYMIDISAAGARVVGATAGSPIFAGQFFFAQESPVAKSSVTSGKASAYFPREDITKQGESFVQTSVIGLYANNQKRRGFQYYLERERIREHYAFLHYNTWWDINGSAVNQRNIQNRINAFGQKLVVERGVKLAGFMVDDGYDNLNVNSANAIWQLKPNQFPNGLRPLNTTASRYGANLGFWMSPGGGYGGRAQRVAIGKKVEPNVETHFQGAEELFRVSGPNYYNLFRTAVFKKMDNNVKSFKFDRIYSSEDVYAVARLSKEMRKRNSDVFINATVGTWGSPYFFWFFDSIWRQGADALYTVRDKQVTYRDRKSYDITTQNPMLPLNSLMVHGIGQGVSYQGRTYSRDAAGRLLDMNKPANLQDFREEVRNYFAQGFNLQELYITPSLMTNKCWDVLAQAANWAHANHEVLLDSRYVGGNPGANQVYGVASWTPTKGVLMLRNPSNRTATITLDVIKTFELPVTHYSNFDLKDPFNLAAPSIAFNIGEQKTFTIPASSILLYEAIPNVTTFPIPSPSLTADSDLALTETISTDDQRTNTTSTNFQ